MADPAIRAALDASEEAARKEAMRAGWCWHGSICEAAPCACCAAIAAAAIAAFLRALPAELEIDTMGEATEFAAVAANVEAAALEARE
jgi:hypothetical protein